MKVQPKEGLTGSSSQTSSTKPVIEAEGKLGINLGVKVSTGAVKVKAEVVKINNVCSSGGCGYELSGGIGVETLNKAGMKAEYSRFIDDKGSPPTGTYFAGIYADNFEMGWGELAESEDIIASFGGGGLFGEAELHFNISEWTRRVVNYFSR